MSLRVSMSSPLLRAVFRRAFAPCALDEDAPHRPGGCGEKVRAIFKGLLAQAQPCLVHERRRLERVARLLVRHFRRRDPAQLRMDCGHQFVAAARLADADCVQDLRDIVGGMLLRFLDVFRVPMPAIRAMIFAGFALADLDGEPPPAADASA